MTPIDRVDRGVRAGSGRLRSRHPAATSREAITGAARCPAGATNNAKISAVAA
ncbi:hypothetical protein I545_2783 [Mycobacterium kansasii 662]|uniref:Uncharacterized protein n=2 Tax=Mycobacterium kansasii TaxID=1768 RepID=A0A1V3WP45_MYCKA|nr:hypothetical protein I547_4737 [Mycobacterium kansasii 824]EUA18689.1 hypothetical protein I545_2783 [Mycobacterium kansasii 662]KEP41290.1 hypothetical protein MKSMC1_37110 [Mycobacterium kansasii]OOK68196.1 hypothetical protein BZL29_6800 [Mycobacterium kansasii]OOK72201.1 hypothetical protein BZL30_5681 [Mycobacterium kansasii]